MREVDPAAADSLTLRAWMSRRVDQAIDLIRNPHLIGPLITIAIAACSPVHPKQPDIATGGRIVSVASPAVRATEILAASESGGLFRSVDGGLTWSIVTGLPSYRMNDVAYAPNNPDIILVTFREDFRTGPGSGPIWRSTDGGRTWSEANVTVGGGPRCPERKSAYGISFRPGGQEVYVGTSCGIAVSYNNGVDWSMESPNASAATVPSRYQDQIASTMASTGRVIIAGFGGIWTRRGRAGTWKKSQTSLAMDRWLTLHGLASSPTNPQHLFIVAPANDISESFDGGITWTAMPGQAVAGSRESFVRTTQTIDPSGAYYLYVGTGRQFQRRKLIDATPTTPMQYGDYEDLWLAHVDPSDVMFKADGVTPFLVAGDGGLMNTADNGLHWNLTGGGKSGLNALQVFQVAGQHIQGPPYERHLYFGTQDNSLYGSLDNGLTWSTSIGGEGYGFQMDPTVAQATDSKVISVYCFPCVTQLSAAGLADRMPWSNAPALSDSVVATDVPIHLKGGDVLQNIYESSLGFRNIFRLTHDWGSSWVPGAVDLSNEIVAGPPVVVSNATENLIYMPIQQPATYYALPKYSVQRMQFPTLSNDTISGIESMGFLQGGEDFRVGLFAVDHQHPENMLVVDVGDRVVKYSMNGGNTWYADHALTNMVTQGGKYVFVPESPSYSMPEPLISALQWDPNNSCHILVGTRMGGIYRSTDGGNNWHHIDQTEQIPEVSSFYFPPTGPIVVSSYGRGLWELNVDRSVRDCPPRHLPPSEVAKFYQVDPDSGDPTPAPAGTPLPLPCPGCSIIVARFGQITGVELENGRVVRFTLRGANAYEFTAEGKEVPLEIPNTSEPIDARKAPRGFQRLQSRHVPIKGLVLRTGVLVAFVAGEGELPFLPTREPRTGVRANAMLNGTPAVAAGESVALYGSGFAANTSVHISYRDDVRELRFIDTRTSASGTFQLNVVAERPRGARTLFVTQQDGKRLVSSVNSFTVRGDDEAKGVAVGQR